MDPDTLRADVPALADTVYLNTGVAGPSPRRVVEASERALEALEYRAPGEEAMYPAGFDVLDDARDGIADHVGADPETVALAQSTSHAMGRLIAAVDWEPGDVVVHTDLEHAAGVFPCDRLRRIRGVEQRVVETEAGRINRKAYKDAVQGARLVVFSSITWTHGTRLPVTELVDVAHDAGTRVLVDAVHSVGQRPVDVEPGARTPSRQAARSGSWVPGAPASSRSRQNSPGSSRHR